MQFHRTAQATGTKMGKDTGHFCSGTAGVMIKGGFPPENYGVRAGSSDSWRERHNAQPVIKTKRKVKLNHEYD